ncbi:MAG TPA: TonB-dependent receptor [Thermoanaerobaculia bacterium]|nr:TonB-dependent receptor [Thermoanaerobaculia bacterium]
MTSFARAPWGKIAMPLIAALWIPAVAAAQGEGVIAGTVTTPSGDAVADAVVEVVDVHRRLRAADGSFRFTGLAPGEYLLRADSPTAGGDLRRVAVRAGETTEVQLVLRVAVHQEEIVVAAGADLRSQLEVAQPTTVLAGEELDRRVAMTLGETLDEQPGVSSTYFGPGASRPVIRGLGGDRIRTLNDGLGTADASSTSPDHAVGLDPLAAERIEVVRGPATLLYGSSAVGGVVNVLDDRIPAHAPDADLTGKLQLFAGSVADEISGGLSLGGGRGKLAWHLDYSNRQTDDHRIPGFAETDEEHAEHDEEEEDGHDEEERVRGVLPNSSVAAESGAVGVSWIDDWGFVGVSVSGFETRYGVPGHGHAGEEEADGDHDDEEEAVHVDLEQRRIDLRGETYRAFGPFRGAKVRLGLADYEHVELEGQEVGTRFTNDAWEGRVELVQRRRGRLSGSLGAQASRSDFAAIGEEAFVPPSVTDSWAVFAFERVELGAVRVEAGGRYERQEIDPEGDLPQRSRDGVSGSLGVVWPFREGYALSASLSRTERLPTANELYAAGPHAATGTFELGDPGLDGEVAVGLDVGLKAEGERFRGAVGAFLNRYDGFIFESFTGEEEDGLEVVEFLQRDAELYGLEGDALYQLLRFVDGDLDLQVRGDLVRAELRATGEPLPRIPPARFGLGLLYHRGPWSASVEARHAFEQERTAEHETSTDSYTLLNASFGYRFFLADSILDVTLRGTNLGDEEARNHVSFLKDRAPLPGRDVALLIRWTF